MNRVLLGRGVLNWPAGERQTDRYGTVMLYPNPDSSAAQEFVTRPEKFQHGRLVAVVVESRKSYHVGDLFRGIYPSTTTVGTTVVLGEGTLFYEGWERVGLSPDDGREEDWLDPHALYRCHHQTVELYFEPTVKGEGA